MTRPPRSLVRLTLLALSVPTFAMGCASPKPPSEARAAADRATERPLLTLAREAAGEPDLLVDRLAALSRSDAGDEAYRLFPMTEREYHDHVVRLSEEEHGAYAGVIFEEVRELRAGLMNPAPDAALRRAQAGDLDTARSALDALDRIAEINARPETLEIARLLAPQLRERAEAARAAIDAIPTAP